MTTEFLIIKDNVSCFYYNIKSDCLSKHTDILQIAFMKTSSSNDSTRDIQFSLHALPTRKVSPSGSRTNGLYLRYSSRRKSFVDKHRKIHNAVSPQVAAQKIVDFLNQDCRTNDRCTLLIAHNGRNFDEERLINFLKRNKVFDNIGEKQNLYFGDSLPSCRKVLKK